MSKQLLAARCATVLNEYYCYENPGAHINLKGKKKYTLSLLLFWDLIWRANLEAQHLYLLFAHPTVYKIQPEGATAQPPQTLAFTALLSLQCHNPLAQHTVTAVLRQKQLSGDALPLTEHLWHRKWPWLFTLKELLNPAQGITKMISQQMGWSVEFSSKSNSLPHHVP